MFLVFLMILRIILIILYILSSLEQESTFLDIGAYTGDTIRKYYDYTQNKFKYIWAIEGQKDSYSKLLQTIDELKISDDRISAFDSILWSEPTQLSIDSKTGSIEDAEVSSDNNGECVDATTVDQLLEERSKKVNLLKINFPGAQEVLKGSKRVISEDKPLIAIVVGWGPYDVYEIPEIIRSFEPHYQLYLDA